MALKLSNAFKSDIAVAASALSPEMQEIRLQGTFKRMKVYLYKPEQLTEKLQEFTFSEVGIDRAGSFWLYIENLMG